MIEKPINSSILEQIYVSSGIIYFDNDLRPFLENVIKELYYSHRELVFRLRLCHIDRAIFKFRQAKEKTCIRNTKHYFKACITSAVLETPLEDLEPFE